jgi:hypothetical protein
MLDKSLNPYSPPAATGDPLEATGMTWRVQGEELLLMEDTVLPAVDLTGDGSRGPLTPVMIPLGISSGTPVKLAKARGYMSVPGLRVRKRRGKWPKRLLWGGSTIVWFQILAPWDNIAANLVLGFGGMEELAFLVNLAEDLIGLAMLVVGWLWGLTIPRIKCRGIQNGWFSIKGIPPHVLAELARRAGDPAPAKKPRKVHRVFAYRLPLAMLMARAPYNPFMWLIAAWLKASRSSQLVQWYFHWSESPPRPPAECDPDLMERWKQHASATGLANWTARWAERIDMPFAGYLTSALVMASPDGKHFAVASVVRDATLTGLLETHELRFLSWTGDGRLLDTSSSPTIPPLPEDRDVLRVRGGVPAVWEAHLSRAGESAVALRGDRELLDRLGHAAARRQETLETAGVFGSVEEMDLPEVADPFPLPPPLPVEQKR